MTGCSPGCRPEKRYDRRRCRAPAIDAGDPAPADDRPALAELRARADAEGWGAARYLAALCEHELAERAQRRIARHLRQIRSAVPARRLLLPPSLNLAELHHVLQAAFGWRDEHLHEFIIGGLVYGAPELADEGATEDDRRTFEATDVHLRDFDLYHVPDPRFLYHYDFGDSWLHLVAFEQRLAKDSGHKYPACIDGARHRAARGRRRTLRLRPSSSKPGATPLTKSTKPCADGPAAPSIPRSSISRPPTRPSKPPVAKPAATTSSVATEPAQPATAIVADRPRKLSPAPSPL